MTAAIPFPNVPILIAEVIEISVSDGSSVGQAKAIIIPEKSVIIEIDSETSILPQGSVYLGHFVQEQLASTGDEGYYCRIVGSSVVVKAFQLNNLNPNLLFAENPLREIAAMEYLNPHPNISELLYCCRDSAGLLYSVTRYYGEDLFELLSNHGPMEHYDAKYFFKQLLTAIVHMHGRNVAHRDICLENIFTLPQQTENTNTSALTPFASRQYLLADFQIATLLPNDAVTASCLMSNDFVGGRMRYTSPEVFTRPVTINPFACDIWSAGVILFTCLTGFPLFDRAIDTDPKFRFIRAGQLTRLLQHLNVDDGSLDPMVVDLLMKIFVVDPERRLTAVEVLQHPWLA